MQRRVDDHNIGAHGTPRPLNVWALLPIADGRSPGCGSLTLARLPVSHVKQWHIGQGLAATVAGSAVFLVPSLGRPITFPFAFRLPLQGMSKTICTID
jgi:hypothetical protein